MATLLGVLAGLITAYVLFLWLFGTLGELWENIKAGFTPDIISALRGTYDADWWAGMRVMFWLVLSALVGHGVYTMLP